LACPIELGCVPVAGPIPATARIAVREDDPSCGPGVESDHWIEVDSIVGIDMRTVRAFSDLGLIWTENRAVRQTWARLRTGDEIER
jgi:hypothetical protein